MSFRSRLTLFFVLIVIVPMISVAVILFRLLADNETGKADARVAEGQTAAISLFRREVDRAGAAAGRIGRDAVLGRQLRSGDLGAARARAATLSRILRVRRVAIERGGRALVDVGPRDATAVASRQLVGADGRAVGTLRVSTITAPQYARSVRGVTSLDVVVRRGGVTLGSTLSAARDRELPRLGTIEAGSREYRVATFESPGFGGQPARVSVLADMHATGSSIAAARALTAGILIGFLLLAFAFAITVSRSLQAQIGRLLEGARRLASGDLGTEVSIEGRDEFAALGAQFNKMARQLEARVEELQAQRARLESSIRRIGETFASNLDRDALLEIVVRTTVDAIDADCGRATARAVAGEPLQERAGTGEVQAYAEVIRAVEAQSLETGRAAESSQDGQNAMAFPLSVSDGTLGLVSVARHGRAFADHERDVFHYLARQACVSFENVDLHDLVQRQAVTDELTGLFNHRRFQDVIDGEVERARRFEQPLGLLMLDLDDFKLINDTYGHQQGDVVLREVAGVLRDSSREIDEPARYGGEELAVALPQTDLEGAYNLAERVRGAIEELRIPRLEGDGVLRVTASLGVAAFPESADGKNALVAAADAALYRAKRAGKNRTERAQPAPAKSVPAK